MSELDATTVKNTPSLFSPTTPEPTIIPESPTIYETLMEQVLTVPSSQIPTSYPPSARKTREDSPPRQQQVWSKESASAVTPTLNTQTS